MRAAIAFAAVLVACASPPPADRSPMVLEDAERFAAIFAGNAAPPAATLQSGYLDPGTPGIAIFTPNRIVNAENLAKVVARSPARYRKAIDICLPAARRVQAEAPALIARVGALLGRADGAPVYVVFGAGNSGGTAGTAGLVLGLEVICQQADTQDAAVQVLRDFIAHEMAHVYQGRAGVSESETDLLRQSMIEGFADFVMERALDGRVVAGADRSRYGLANEASLWREFKADVDAGKRNTDWLYRYKVARPGQPPDMGYWFGKRICESYYARATDKVAAMRTLLEMRDPHEILAASGYGREF